VRGDGEVSRFDLVDRLFRCCRQRRDDGSLALPFELEDLLEEVRDEKVCEDEVRIAHAVIDEKRFEFASHLLLLEKCTVLDSSGLYLFLVLPGISTNSLRENSRFCTS
jgi:hypothetical protein